MLEIGSLVDGRYKILNEIGHGGMSNVYLAMNERANKQWAVKEVRKSGRNSDKAVFAHMMAEIHILRHLDNPHLPSIVDVIEKDDSFLIVMDYIEGRLLSRILREEGPQSEEDVADWAIQISDTLAYLHSRKPPVIYRDLKPSNLMLRPDGQVMMIDFGTAREYRNLADGEDTTCLGTKGYAAPEQFEGSARTDARTDFYCLGATMYHLLTGHSPAETPFRLYPIRCWNPSLSSGLEQVIGRCTRTDPGERYQSDGELMYALRHYKELDEDFRQEESRRLRCFGAAAALCLAGLVGAAGFHLAAVQASARSYEAFLQAAVESQNKEDKAAACKAAVRIDPSREEAYTQLLEEVYLADGNFSPEEAEDLRKLLHQPLTRARKDILSGLGERCVEDALRSDSAAYGDFSYRLGLACFYYYDTDGNKAMSRARLETAAACPYIDDIHRERAGRLAVIAKYYEGLCRCDKAGDRKYSYAEYWEDLCSLTDGDLAELDNVRTAIVMYREFLCEMNLNAANFRRAGVQKGDMLEQLKKLQKGIKLYIVRDFGRDEDVMAEADELQRAVDGAEESIEAAFSAREESKAGSIE